MRKAWQAGAVVTLLLSALSAVPAKAVSSNPAAVCSAGICTVNFPYTGDYYSWTAPITGTYTLELWGAQGGDAGYNGTVFQAGGNGGYSKGNINLTTINTIHIYVGGKGEGAESTSTSSSTAGGWNGGGIGYNGSSTTDTRGAGGGGASDVRVSGNALANRVIVAGGGGGGVKYTGYGTNYPGVGGGTSGGDGATANYNATYSYNGKGASQSAGGARGANCGGAVSMDGSLGNGGRSDMHASYGGGGGGGGYYGGGGGGCGMGAGGGSGYVGGVTTTTITAGNASMPNPSGGTMTGRTGNGYVRITYAYVAPTISLTSAGNATSASKGIGIVLTAAISSSGSVTFYANQKRIAGCINLAASSGNKTCTWKPTGLRGNQIYATLSQSGSVVATSSTLSIAGTKRVGTR